MAIYSDKMTFDGEAYVAVEVLIRRANLSYGCGARWCREGKFHAIKYLSKWFVREKDFDAYLKSRIVSNGIEKEVTTDES